MVGVQKFFNSGTMQCGRGNSFGDRLVENYTGLVPLLWKAVLRFKESGSPSGSYKKLGDIRDESDVLEAQWGSGGGKYYHDTAKPSSSTFAVSSHFSRRRRWRVTFRMPKVYGSWGGFRPAQRLRRY